MPLYLWGQFAESEAAFWAAEQKELEKSGDQGQKLWNEMLGHARDVQLIDGQFRPELSYLPE